MHRRPSALVAALALLACASPTPHHTTYPDLRAEDTDPRAGFEQPPVLQVDVRPLEVEVLSKTQAGRRSRAARFRRAFLRSSR